MGIALIANKNAKDYDDSIIKYASKKLNNHGDVIITESLTGLAEELTKGMGKYNIYLPYGGDGTLFYLMNYLEHIEGGNNDEVKYCPIGGGSINFLDYYIRCHIMNGNSKLKKLKVKRDTKRTINRLVKAVDKGQSSESIKMRPMNLYDPEIYRVDPMTKERNQDGLSLNKYSMFLFGLGAVYNVISDFESGNKGFLEAVSLAKKIYLSARKNGAYSQKVVEPFFVNLNYEGIEKEIELSVAAASTIGILLPFVNIFDKLPSNALKGEGEDFFQFIATDMRLNEMKKDISKIFRGGIEDGVDWINLALSDLTIKSDKNLKYMFDGELFIGGKKAEISLGKDIEIICV